MRKSPIVIVDYDPGWPAAYEAEKALILRAIGPALVAVEHVGSTAVPGLAAKPIIDIAAGIRSLEDAPTCIQPLERIGYEYVPEYEKFIPDRRYFRKGNVPGTERRSTHHLHMAEIGGDFWVHHLLFRDFLRAHPEEAQRYAELKRKLARRFGRDRDGYTDAKTEFIEGIVARAKEDM